MKKGKIIAACAGVLLVAAAAGCLLVLHRNGVFEVATPAVELQKERKYGHRA